MGVNVLIKLRKTLEGENISQERLTNLIQSLPQGLVELRMSLGSLVSMIFSDSAAITPSLLGENATRLYGKCFCVRELYIDPIDCFDFDPADYSPGSEEEPATFKEEITDDEDKESPEDVIAADISEIMNFLLLCGANTAIVM